MIKNEIMIFNSSGQYKNQPSYVICITIPYIFATLLYLNNKFKPDFAICKFLNKFLASSDEIEFISLDETGLRDKKPNTKLSLEKMIILCVGVASILTTIISIIGIIISAHRLFTIYTSFLNFCFIMALEAIIIKDIVNDDVTKIFYYIRMIIFIFITSFIMSSLFSRKCLPIVCIYLICYILTYGFKLCQLESEDEEESIKEIMLNYKPSNLIVHGINFLNKYSRILDVINFFSILITATLTVIFFKTFSFYEALNTSSTISVSVGKYFNENETINSLNFKNSKYLLFVNPSNQVVLYTPTLLNGMIIGFYENNIIKLTVSKYVKVNIETKIFDDNVVSQLSNAIIMFNDQSTTIVGPNMSDSLLIEFNRTDAIMFDNNYLLPTGEYILSKNLSTIASKSSVNKIFITHDLNQCQLWYPNTQINIGNINDYNITLNVNSIYNNKQIFKIENESLLYLSPVTENYVVIDSIKNLINSGFYLA